MLITYNYQKILTRTKQILWKEHTNQAELKEKEDMDLDPEWKKEVEGRLLQDEERKEEKDYHLKIKT